MYDFVRKDFLWDAWDRGLDNGLVSSGRFHLKTIQDLAVYAHLRDSSGQTIAEIGGGDSRVLRILSKSNRCTNIEKFEGADGGPPKIIEIEGVTNILAFLGERSPKLPNAHYDVVFSVSVVEHVPSERLSDFLDDGMRILKSGGLWLHAIDFYLEDRPTDGQEARYSQYRNWMTDPRLKSIGPIFDGPLKFSCDMATNPDNVMYSWGKIAPALTPLRKRAQSVSIILAGRKV